MHVITESKDALFALLTDVIVHPVLDPSRETSFKRRFTVQQRVVDVLPLKMGALCADVAQSREGTDERGRSDVVGENRQTKYPKSITL